MFLVSTFTNKSSTFNIETFLEKCYFQIESKIFCESQYHPAALFSLEYIHASKNTHEIL